jgi:hypothetical protein
MGFHYRRRIFKLAFLKKCLGVLINYLAIAGFLSVCPERVLDRLWNCCHKSARQLSKIFATGLPPKTCKKAKYLQTCAEL